MVLMGYSGARGTMISEKNLMLKISSQTPFKFLVFLRRLTFAKGLNTFFYAMKFGVGGVSHW
jgi:hypothetical protein